MRKLIITDIRKVAYKKLFFVMRELEKLLLRVTAIKNVKSVYNIICSNIYEAIQLLLVCDLISLFEISDEPCPTTLGS